MSNQEIGTLVYPNPLPPLRGGKNYLLREGVVDEALAGDDRPRNQNETGNSLQVCNEWHLKIQGSQTCAQCGAACGSSCHDQK